MAVQSQEWLRMPRDEEQLSSCSSPDLQEGIREGDVAVFHTSASILEYQSGFYSSHHCHFHVP